MNECDVGDKYAKGKVMTLESHVNECDDDGDDKYAEDSHPESQLVVALQAIDCARMSKRNAWLATRAAFWMLLEASAPRSTIDQY